MKKGEWIIVEVGDNYCQAIGYVTHVYRSIGCIQVMKVIRIMNGTWEWLSPSAGSYKIETAKPADKLLDRYQDKSALIDLALLTHDEKWFKELTEKILQH